MPEQERPKFTVQTVPQAFIRFESGGGEAHLLPYGHLLYGNLQPRDDNNEEEIYLYYAAHEVNICGTNLREVFRMLQSSKVQAISLGNFDFQPPHKKPTDLVRFTISEIHVQQRANRVHQDE